MLGGKILRDLAKAIARIHLKYYLRSVRRRAHRIKIEKKQRRGGDDHDNNQPNNNFLSKKNHHDRFLIEFTIDSIKKFASMLDPP